MVVTMHDIIEPSEYDAVVASTGLVECLLASALLKAGKSVLLLDQADVYGGTYASYNFAGLSGSTDPAENPHSASIQTDQLTLPSLPDGLRLVQRQAAAGQGNCQVPGLPIQHVSNLKGQQLPSNTRRDYILDLAPRVMYQAEALVDILVKTRSHNYLEFKALEHSYIYQDGALRPIPASRADVFKDRRLGLADKRALMTFLSACVEAQEHKGPLAAALNSEQPFCELLARQGLASHVQEIVLYGIAKALSSSCSNATDPQQALNSMQPMTASAGLKALSLYAASMGRFGTDGAFMFPTYGCGSIPEALVRHCAVKGAVTALRQPVVGLVVGSAHIRLPNPNPNPTPDVGPYTPSTEQADWAAGNAGIADTQQADAQATTSSTEHADTQAGLGIAGVGSMQVTAAPAEASSSQQGHLVAAQDAGSVLRAAGVPVQAGSPMPPDVPPDMPPDVLSDIPSERQTVRGVVLGNGQLVSCRHGIIINATVHDSLAMPLSSATAGHEAPASTTTDAQPTTKQHTAVATDAQPTTQQHTASIARAVAVLDGPLVPNVNMCTITIPPAVVADVVAATSEARRMPVQPVYGLLVSYAAAVAPVNRYLLYLSTCTSGAPAPEDAQQLLLPILQLFARPFTASPTDTNHASQSGVQTDAASQTGLRTDATVADVAAPAPGSTQNGSSTNSAAAAAAKPAMLQAHFYMQPLRGWEAQVPRVASSTDVLPNLVVCPTAGATLHGYVDEVACAQALLEQHFPHVPWLLQDDTTQPDDGHEGDEGNEPDRKAPASMADDFDDTDFAIDELQQALESLTAEGLQRPAEHGVRQ